MDKFIIAPEEKGNLPSQALVSLAIIIMFNSILRQKRREIIDKKFPELSAFADLLYESEGRIGVKMADGTWSYIPVYEGFLHVYDISETCVHNGASDDKFEFFLLKSSPNTCHKRIKDKAATRVLSFLSIILTGGFTKKKLGKILQ